MENNILLYHKLASRDGTPIAGVYLVKTETPETAFDIFGALVEKQGGGLALTRIPPAFDAADSGRVTYVLPEKEYVLENVEAYWLATQAHAGIESIRPSSLEAMREQIRKAKDGTPVILQGLEFIINARGFPDVFDLIGQLSELATTGNKAIIIPVNPDALDEKEMANLASETVVINPNKTING